MKVGLTVAYSGEVSCITPDVVTLKFTLGRSPEQEFSEFTVTNDHSGQIRWMVETEVSDSDDKSSKVLVKQVSLIPSSLFKEILSHTSSAKDIKLPQLIGRALAVTQQAEVKPTYPTLLANFMRANNGDESLFRTIKLIDSLHKIIEKNLVLRTWDDQQTVGQRIWSKLREIIPAFGAKTHIQMIEGILSQLSGEYPTDKEMTSWVLDLSVLSVRQIPEDKHNYLTPRKNLIGYLTADRNIEINLTKPTFEGSRLKYGQEYKSESGSFLDAVMNNSMGLKRIIQEIVQTTTENVELAEARATLAIVANLMRTHKIVIIGRNVNSMSFDDQKMADEETVFVRYTGKEFTRVFITSSEEVFANLENDGSINVKVDSLEMFLTLDNVGLISQPTPFCFYHAVLEGLFDEGIVAEDQICTVEGIKELAYKRNVGIIDGNDLFIPRTCKFEELAKIVFTEKGHCYSTNLEEVLRNVKCFNIRFLAEWSKNLNGPLPGKESFNITSDVCLSTLRDWSNRMMRMDAYRKKAIGEATMYNLTLAETLVAAYRVIYSDKKDYFLKARTGCFIYDYYEKKFVNGDPDCVFVHGWDGENFVTVDFDRTTRIYYYDGISRYLVFSHDLNFIREKDLLNFVYDHMSELEDWDDKEIKITLIDGVPGCGKTYYILKNHDPISDLVCTATKSGQLEFVEKGDNKATCYRTYDSVLLNQVGNHSLLFADEGLMIHFGELLIVAFKVKAVNVEVLGDSLQIPFISRVSGMQMLYHILIPDEIDHNYVTRRCPKSMVPILRQFYPQMTTKSEVQGEVKVCPINRNCTTFNAADCYLTFTQAEKDQVISMGYENVYTIHEAQGKTYDDIGLIRLVPQFNAIYDSQPHIIVGISRHKVNLTYYTVSPTDSVAKLLKGGNVVSVKLRPHLESILTPTLLEACNLPRKIMKRRELKKSPHADSEFSKYVIGQNWYSYCEEVSYEVARFKCDPVVDSETDIVMDPQQVQILLNQLYEPVDESRITELLCEDPYPLPKGVIADIDKLLGVKVKSEMYCEPVLKTVQPNRYGGSIIETLMAIEKRTLNPPILHETRHPKLVDEVVDVFFRTFVDQAKLEEATMRHQYGNRIYYDDWLNTRTESQLKQLDSLELKNYSGNLYASHVKPDHKPILDNSHNENLTAGQIVTAHNPLITARCSGPVRCFTSILKESLKTKWMINDGVTSEDRDGFLNFILCNEAESTLLEIDFSKFDKSQEDILLEIQISIMRRCGAPEEFLADWLNWHQINLLIFHTLGIRVTSKFQRRSGDVLTFIGNTIVAMAVIAYTHDLESAIGGIFGGDDSLVYLRKTTMIRDQSAIIASLFNLIAKIEFHPNCPCFSSHFVVNVNGWWRFVPDPMKAIIRIGRKDMYCREHAIYYHESFKDNMKYFTNESVKIAMNKVVIARYKGVFATSLDSLFCIFDFINMLVKSQQKFLNLYFSNSFIWERPLPISLKNKFKTKLEFVDGEETWYI